jgi:outer membrane receptor protein involved in Fe transport
MYAQVRTGTILGTVTDSTGAVLPGVEVTANNVNTGQSRLAITGDEGRYQIPLLDTGSYEVRAALTGFQTAVRRGITLQVGQEAVIDLALQVGEISEEVVVTGEAPLVNTTSSTLSQRISQDQVSDLPLNSRNLVSLSLIAPGVTQARTASYAGETTSPGAVKISIGGARIYMTGYTLDGVDITDSSRSSGVGGASGSLFGVETMRELQVITNNYSAQYSRFAGGVISIVTKSGTNDFHGSGFWFHRNDNMDARNFFDRDPINPLTREQPEFKRHQFGGTIGGPIVQDKSFFFFSYEGFRENKGQSLTETVPDADVREGRIVDINGGLISTFTPNPAADIFVALYPLPNVSVDGGGTGTYINVADAPTNEDFITARWDHNFSDTDSFFARYTWQDGERVLVSALPGDGWTSGSFATYVALEEKHIFSPSVINTFRVGFQRTTYSQDPPIDDVCGGDCTGNPLKIGLRDGAHFGDLIPGSGVATLGTFLSGKNVTNMFSYADDLLFTRGSHSLKLGVNFTRYQNNDFFDGWPGGRQQFSSVQDFVQANPVTWRGKTNFGGSLRGARQWVLGFYIQDDIKLTPNLSLNAGLRYEPITTPYEVNGIQYTFGSDPINGTLTPTKSPPFFENPSKLNFAPRIGLAWDPFGTGKTSIRTGFGLFHDTILFYHYANAMRRNCPINTTLVIGSPAFPRPDEPPGLGSDTTCVPGTSWQQFEFDLAQPYMMQWNFSLQQEVANTTFTFAYVGSKGTNLQLHRNINVAEPTEIRPDGTKVFANGAPFPVGRSRRNSDYGDILLWDYGVSSVYSGFNFSARRRFTQGLQFQASYTFGRSIDAGSRANNGDFSGAGLEPLDPYNVAGTNRGLSDHHVAHAFRLSYAWALPVSGLSGASAVFLQGWQLNGIVSLTTGDPLQINTGSGTGPGGSLTDYNGDAAFIGGSGPERPNVRSGASGNPVLNDGREPQNYFDAGAFELQERGTYGNLGRNTLVGPGVANFDFSLLKDTNLSELVTMQFRVEFFNIFNRTNFAGGRGMTLNVFNGINADGTGRESATAGRITRTATTSRQIQLGLRLFF